MKPHRLLAGLAAPVVVTMNCGSTGAGSASHRASGLCNERGGLRPGRTC